MAVPEGSDIALGCGRDGWSRGRRVAVFYALSGLLIEAADALALTKPPLGEGFHIAGITSPAADQSFTHTFLAFFHETCSALALSANPVTIFEGAGGRVNEFTFITVPEETYRAETASAFVDLSTATFDALVAVPE